ncbi:protein-associating with the carboxyl-terminal domain of ezrin isoform X1 [Eptesicus fuscus]|uniref:protein-associating with the carboxyl-terminal domain of ezrin isoform X1 n=1 Tax=Eptesicus fuscus TaxID=29078 RepID=UPI0024043E35|nr:protein-associating with the carboxyl-terminal domain of ezrin isoform X1 [Eptesicus fuscus]XP_054568249.1 protein-associating with the carboxyl-terminal domain of ezrin isoform X1 [Eptesicus fuscus]
MGAESSALKSCALKGPPVTLHSGLAVFPAELQDGKVASVFVYKRENEDKVNKAAKHLKTLRHPCLLRFLSCTVEADGIHLVTERVQPLEEALETLSSAEVCAGIYDILLALIFLHDRGHLTHNNVCLSSVFVSEDGHWKLGGMETVCRVPQATPEFLRSIQSVRDPACIPPEETSPEFTTLPEVHGHARDAYAFGMLVERLLTDRNGQADALRSFRQALHSALLNPVPQRRPALCTLLSHDFFRNDFLEVVNFLKSLTLKSEEEKAEFFKFLLDRVSCLSEELIASRLVPLLLNQLVFAEPVAVKSFLPHLLGPKKDGGPGEPPRLLSPALFRSRVVPVLLQLFQVHEEHVRTVLLAHLEAYVEHFTPEQLRTVILPQVLLGLRDTSSSIVAITLHSLAVLVSLLGPEVVVGGQRTKVFKRTAPSFTKAIDLSPEDSPTHVACSQHRQPSPGLEHPSRVFPKGFLSDDRPIGSKKHKQQDSYTTLSQTGRNSDRFSQPRTFSLNGLSDVKNTSGDSESFLPSPQASEEWPDWSEPGEPESRTVNTQVWPPEPARPPLTALKVVETWDDRKHSSLGNAVSPGGGITGTSGEHKAIPTSLPLTEEAKPLASSQPQKTSPIPDQPPKVSSRERHPKVPSELGLGEEFTIQVKKKLAQDPELDWFADMIPEIKPSGAILVLPELRTETVIPNTDGISPGMQFSSKFAAAEMTEAESDGWGDAGELNWGDSSW